MQSYKYYFWLFSWLLFDISDGSAGFNLVLQRAKPPVHITIKSEGIHMYLICLFESRKRKIFFKHW